MKLFNIPREADDRSLLLDLGPNESRALRAAIGEVCYGFRLESFEARIGITEHEATALFERLDCLDLNQQNKITLTWNEFSAARSAHAETLRELGPDEYATRTGVNFEEGQALLRALGQATPS